MSAVSNFTTRLQWLATVSRLFDLGLDALRRRMYIRKFKRYDLEFGWASVEVEALENAPRCSQKQFTLLDVSPEGLMLRSYDPLPIDAGLAVRVEIDEEHAILRGIIRHVTGTLGGYKVGVQLLFSE